MFDIAPVLKTDIRLDDKPWFCYFLSEYERSRVRSQPVLLVAKCCSDPLQWRISTSLAEREIFRRLVFNKAVAAVLKKAKTRKVGALWSNKKHQIVLFEDDAATLDKPI